jgi:hypothetical protein
MNYIAEAILSLNKKNNNDYEFHMKASVSSEQEYNDNVDFIIGADKNNLAKISDTQLYSWTEIEKELPLVKFNINLQNFRSKRNDLLAKTDWTALSDNTMSSEMREYRQKLRDATEGLDTVEKVQAYKFPEEVLN